MSKFSLAPVEDFEKWDEFVEKSPKGTFFSASDYIQAIGKPFELVFKWEEQKAGLLLIFSNDGVHFFVYNLCR